MKLIFVLPYICSSKSTKYGKVNPFWPYKSDLTLISSITRTKECIKVGSSYISKESKELTSYKSNENIKLYP